MVYKAFVRPRLEYAHLTWMGAADTYLAKLDAVQDAAVTLFVPDAPPLDTLDHRRRVGALTYLYKLQSWECPDRLRAMVPPRLPCPAGRTRAEVAARATWHRAKFANPLTFRSLARVQRSFPYGVIDDWNALPPALFTRDYTLEGLQDFKVSVHRAL